MKVLSKDTRRAEIKEYLRDNPFATDEELAQRFSVSIQTIRLDRSALNIPELRVRIKQVAQQNYGQVKSIKESEIIGELLELELDDSAMSLLEVTRHMVLDKSKIIRGHHLFAQANSLAVAMVDSPLALTGSARIKYLTPILLGEKVLCKATLLKKKGEKLYIETISTVNGRQVFQGDFIIFAKEREGS